MRARSNGQSIVPLRSAHIIRAGKTCADAFSDTPLCRYLWANDFEERTWLTKLLDRTFFTFLITTWVYQKICLTRMGGKSFIIITPPRDFAKESPPFLRTLSHYTFNRLRKTSNPEQTKRRRETDERIEELIATLLDSRASDMFYVSCLATEPASQGKGNASLLIQAAISHANQSRRSIWLCTDSEANVKFYSMHGFETIGVTMVGDENPAWHGPPVILSLMVHEHD